VQGVARVIGRASQGVPRGLQLAEREADGLERGPDVLHHRAEARDDAAGDAREKAMSLVSQVTTVAIAEPAICPNDRNSLEGSDAAHPPPR
jgi:hypothetical protein